MGDWSLVLKEEGNRRLPGTERAGMLCVRDGREDRDGILGGCAEGFKQAELSWRERLAHVGVIFHPSSPRGGSK